MQKPIRIFHIDDDKRVLNYTQKRIKEIGEFEYLGSAENAQEGLAQVTELKPDILLLDIEMPGKDGFWVAENLKEQNTFIVFVTNHPEFAVEAFNCFALHYIVKPLRIEDLKKTLNKYSKYNSPSSLELQGEQIAEIIKNVVRPSGIPLRIFVNTHKEIKILNLAEVVYIMAEGSYTHFYMNDNTTIVSGKNMRTYTELVEKNPDFIKVHRSYIINQSHLLSINKKKMDVTFCFKNNIKITMSTFRKDEWLKRFN